VHGPGTAGGRDGLPAVRTPIPRAPRCRSTSVARAVWQPNVPDVAIVEDGGVPSGYALWRLYGRAVHVVHVVVASEARGAGLGGDLLAEVRRRAVALGATRWYLTVKQDNEPALRLYRRVGMAIEQQAWAVEAVWADLEGRLPERSEAEPLVPVVVVPSDDGDLAQRFGVDAGRLAVLRQNPDEVVCAVYERGVPVGFGAFDPGYPRIFPIRVARSDSTRDLFRALRQYARHARVHVTVEGDRALYEALCAAGAVLQHASFRMGAPLPL
jgi:GNAT superfamily N-acetyltransferase